MTRFGLPKLVATDLDGTLVRGDETVSGYTSGVLGRVRATGVVVVGATGRGPRLTELVLRDIPSASYLVMGGGGHVLDLTDPDDPLVLLDERLPGRTMADIYAAIEARTGTLSIFVESETYPNAPLIGDFDPVWPYPERFEVRPRQQALDAAVVKGFARHDGMHVDDLLAVARQVVPAEVASITQAGLGYIEICPPGVDKASGLQVVAEATGIDPADALVFGDMPNDLPMMYWAGFGSVAVANAHPAVLAAAGAVTDSNESDGVARYLEGLFGF